MGFLIVQIFEHHISCSVARGASCAQFIVNSQSSDAMYFLPMRVVVQRTAARCGCQCDSVCVAAVRQSLLIREAWYTFARAVLLLQPTLIVGYCQSRLCGVVYAGDDCRDCNGAGSGSSLTLHELSRTRICMFRV